MLPRKVMIIPNSREFLLICASWALAVAAGALIGLVAGELLRWAA